MVLREHFLSPCNKSMGGGDTLDPPGAFPRPASLRVTKTWIRTVNFSTVFFSFFSNFFVIF